jgi:hypothetical protein
MSNLPTEPKGDSAAEIKEFFDQYLVKSISYPSNQVDAVIGFFESKGFEKTAAISTATVLLQQAKIDEVNVFQLIDTLQGLTRVQLSEIVATVLNYNRQKISTLGFRIENSQEKFERRNIIDDRPARPAPVTINTAVKNNFSVTRFTFDSNTITWDGA